MIFIIRQFIWITGSWHCKHSGRWWENQMKGKSNWPHVKKNHGSIDEPLLPVSFESKLQSLQTPHYSVVLSFLHEINLKRSIRTKQGFHKMLKVININRIEFYHILKINKSVQSRLFNTKSWDHSQLNKECWRTIPGLHQLYLKWGTVLGEAAVQDELYSKQKKQPSIEAILSGLMSNG